jgi:hypothetical protein
MIKKFIKDQIEYWSLPPIARAIRNADHRGLGSSDPGAARVIDEALAWLGRAQDGSSTADGGVARHYSLVKGWGASYPETTGYIVPTILEHARSREDAELLARGRRMLDWLVAIQFPEGGFQGGMVNQTPRVPVTFNTGQILLGLAAGVRVFGDAYRDPMNRAADWLANSLDPDGCWRKHRTPFASADDKAYETHVAWGLFEAARVDPGRGWGEAGLRQVRWAIQQQQPNGWMAKCCLSDASRPLTHTLGYALRGMVEAHRWSPQADVLAAARLLADGLSRALAPDGRLPGRLFPDWTAAADYVCVTGASQIAHSWLLLFEITGERRYLELGRRANAYVRRTIDVDGPPQTRGGVKGSFPVDGGYGRFEYLNWAAKFTIDSQAQELALARA